MRLLNLREAVVLAKNIWKGVSNKGQMDMATNYCMLLLDRMDTLTEYEWDILIDVISKGQQQAELLINLIDSLINFNEDEVWSEE